MGNFLSFIIFGSFINFTPALYAKAHPQAAIYFFNVGQGDLTVLWGKDECLFVDAGGDHHWAWPLKTFLKTLCPRSNTLVLTHFDRDHIMNMATLVKLVPVSHVYVPHLTPTSKTGKRLLETLRGKPSISFHTAVRGQTIPLKMASAHVLWPPKKPFKDFPFENARSIVLLIKVNGGSILLTGDAPGKVEGQLSLTQVDILKVGHHGSRSSSGKYFLSAIQAKTCVISHSSPSPYGHPHKETLKRLRDARCSILSTARLGTIHVGL